MVGSWAACIISESSRRPAAYARHWINVSSYREKLDLFVLRERISLTWKSLLVAVCGVLIFGSLFLLYIPVQTVELLGTVVAHRAQTSQSSSRRYLVVRLDDGWTVQARVYRHADYRPGRRVSLTETTTRFLGYKWYQFNRYVEESTDREKSFP